MDNHGDSIEFDSRFVLRLQKQPKHSFEKIVSLEWLADGSVAQLVERRCEVPRAMVQIHPES